MKPPAKKILTKELWGREKKEKGDKKYKSLHCDFADSGLFLQENRSRVVEKNSLVYDVVGVASKVPMGGEAAAEGEEDERCITEEVGNVVELGIVVFVVVEETEPVRTP